MFARCESHRPRGYTLLELIVVLAILGVVTGLSALAVSSAESRAPDAWEIELNAARRAATTTGRAVAVQLIRSGHVVRVAALPDGRVVADSALDVDPLTGSRRHVP